MEIRKKYIPIACEMCNNINNGVKFAQKTIDGVKISVLLGENDKPSFRIEIPAQPIDEPNEKTERIYITAKNGQMKEFELILSSDADKTKLSIGDSNIYGLRKMKQIKLNRENGEMVKIGEHEYWVPKEMAPILKLHETEKTLNSQSQTQDIESELGSY